MFLFDNNYRMSSTPGFFQWLSFVTRQSLLRLWWVTRQLLLNVTLTYATVVKVPERWQSPWRQLSKNSVKRSKIKRPSTNASPSICARPNKWPPNVKIKKQKREINFSFKFLLSLPLFQFLFFFFFFSRVTFAFFLFLFPKIQFQSRILLNKAWFWWIKLYRKLTVEIRSSLIYSFVRIFRVYWDLIVAENNNWQLLDRSSI